MIKLYVILKVYLNQVLEKVCSCIAFVISFGLVAKADSFIQVVIAQAAVQRCNATVTFGDRPEAFYPPVVNDGDLHKHFVDVAGNLLGINKVHTEMKPMMGAEDFAFYQEAIPGYFIGLGVKTASNEPFQELHSPYLTINEDALPYGAALHASLATNYLINMSKEYRDEL